VTVRYTQGLGVDEVLAQLRSGASYYYEADGLGSITSLSDSAGVVGRSYNYSAFGWWVSGSGTLLNPYHFTGRESDTGWFTGFNYHRARYYDSAVGRFISEDPIGFDGGMNFYTYVENNPAKLTDPSGTQAVPLALPGYAGTAGISGIPVAGQIIGAGAAGYLLGRLIGHIPIGQGRTVDDAVTDLFTDLILRLRNDPSCLSRVYCTLVEELEIPDVDATYKLCAYSCSDGQGRTIFWPRGVRCPPIQIFTR